MKETIGTWMLKIALVFIGIALIIVLGMLIAQAPLLGIALTLFVAWIAVGMLLTY